MFVKPATNIWDSNVHHWPCVNGFALLCVVIKLVGEGVLWDAFLLMICLFRQLNQHRCVCIIAWQLISLQSQSIKSSVAKSTRILCHRPSPTETNQILTAVDYHFIYFTYTTFYMEDIHDFGQTASDSIVVSWKQCFVVCILTFNFNDQWLFV